MKDKRIFKRTEIDPERRPGWVADLNKGGPINPDLYWYFRTKKAAEIFLSLVDGGMDARQAAHEAAEEHASGTKPDTSLHLGDQRKRWLAQNGGIQPTIQRLVDEAITRTVVSGTGTDAR